MSRLSRSPWWSVAVLVVAAVVVVGVALAAAAARRSPTPSAAPEAAVTPVRVRAPSPSPTPVPSPSAPPAARPATGPTPAADGTITLAIAGDVQFVKGIGEQAEAEAATMLAAIAPVLHDVDLALVNLETPVSDRGEDADKTYVFRSPPAGLAALTAAGVDAVALANNHTLDVGEIGLRDTLEAAAAAGLRVVGAGLDEAAATAPLVVTEGDRSVAVLNATEILPTVEWEADEHRPGVASAKEPALPRLVDAVEAAAEAHDGVVVVLHWGTEGEACPDDDQVELATALAAAGADAVVGTHAHRVQGSGRLGSTYVHYGLGNFVWHVLEGFGAESAVVRLAFGPGGLAVDEVPVVLRRWLPHPVAAPPVDPTARQACSGLAPW